MLAANFVEETTTSIAGTGGNGDITLTAITGKPRFSTALGSNKRYIRYVIEDTVNNKAEAGIGYVASNVLTRVRPQVTWDGTTWNDKAPSALAFGSSPTAGNIRIRMAPTAEAMAPVIPARQTVIAGDPNWRDYRFSGHLDGAPGNAAGYSMTAERAYFIAYRHDMAGVLNGVKLEVTAAVASSGIKWALYDFNADGLPAAKIVDGNVIDTSSTGYKTDTTISTWTPANGIWLPPGWYALALLPSHAVGIRGAATRGSPTPFGLSSLSYGNGDMIYVAGNYASGLPADAASLASGATMQAKNIAGCTLYVGLKVVQ